MVHHIKTPPCEMPDDNGSYHCPYRHKHEEGVCESYCKRKEEEKWVTHSIPDGKNS